MYVAYRFIGRTEALGNQSSEKPVHQFMGVIDRDDDQKQIEALKAMVPYVKCDGDYINLYRGTLDERGEQIAGLHVYRIKGTQYRTLYVWSEEYNDDCITEL